MTPDPHKNLRRAVARDFTDRVFFDKAKKISEITPEDFDELIGNCYLEPANKELIKDIQLIGYEKQSPSGVKAGGSKIVTLAFSDTGDSNLYQPSSGEVWILQTVNIAVVASGSWSVSLGLNDTMAVSKSKSATGNANLVFADLEFPTSNFYMDENMKLTISKTGSFSEIGVHLLLTRCR